MVTACLAEALLVVAALGSSPAAAEPRPIVISLAPRPVEEPAPAVTPPDEEAEITDPFESGRWTFNAAASIEFGDEGDEQYLGRFGAGHFLLDGLALNAELLAGAADPKSEEDEVVVGLDLVLRWHLLRGGEGSSPWSAFLDIGGGIQQASGEFPPGSHFNFRSRLGFGGTIDVGDDVSLILGASFVHVSNSNTGDENPGVSGTLAYVGVLVHF